MILHPSEIVVDSFAGGGGASKGIEMATGKSPDIAINHDDHAIEMHIANHPNTLHLKECVWKVDLAKHLKGRRIGLLWASPDCRHFSRAKGSQPVSKSVRSLAWTVCKWAAKVKPRIFVLENVREFAEWGPIVPAWKCSECDWRGTEGQATLFRKKRRCPRCEKSISEQLDIMIPDPEKKGQYFKRFCSRLRNLGYELDVKVLNAADYGAPTNRRRLFLIARRDGERIVWPEPSHGPGRIPYRNAASCIDWDIPCPSIFDRKRPLVDATMRRIAKGIERYVLNNPKPFLVNLTHGVRTEDLGEPFNVITGAHRGEKAVVSPVLSKVPNGDVIERGLVSGEMAFCPVISRIGQTGSNGNLARSIEDPLPTSTSKAEILLVSAGLAQVGYGERPGQEPRTNDITKPLGTAVSGGAKQGIITAHLSRAFGTSDNAAIDEPLPTTMPGGMGKTQLIAAYLAKHFGGMVGIPLDGTPLPTTTSRGTQTQLVSGFLVHLNHGDKQWSDLTEPMRTITTGNHAASVYAFLTKYNAGAVGAPLDDPMQTATRKERTGLVFVTIEGGTYVLVDIGMRMLTPRELARGQGFPDSYKLIGSKTKQVKAIGNSVCPQVAEAIVRANLSEGFKVPKRMRELAGAS